MKPLTIARNSKETLLDTAKRAYNQAILNNKIILLQVGAYTCIVYPYDIISNIVAAIKTLTLRIQLEELIAKQIAMVKSTVCQGDVTDVITSMTPKATV